LSSQTQILIEIMAGTDPRHNKFIIAPAPTCTPKGAPLCFAFNAWFPADYRSSSVASWPISNRSRPGLRKRHVPPQQWGLRNAQSQIKNWGVFGFYRQKAEELRAEREADDDEGT